MKIDPSSSKKTIRHKFLQIRNKIPQKKKKRFLKQPKDIKTFVLFRVSLMK
jgi:hypothetical protein